MGKPLVEGGPPEEPVEQSVISPARLKMIVGDLGAPGAILRIAALTRMDYSFVAILAGRPESVVAADLPDLPQSSI